MNLKKDVDACEVCGGIFKKEMIKLRNATFLCANCEIAKEKEKEQENKKREERGTIEITYQTGFVFKFEGTRGQFESHSVGVSENFMVAFGPNVAAKKFHPALAKEKTE